MESDGVRKAHVTLHHIYTILKEKGFYKNELFKTKTKADANNFIVSDDVRAVPDKYYGRLCTCKSVKFRK